MGIVSWDMHLRVLWPWVANKWFSGDPNTHWRHCRNRNTWDKFCFFKLERAAQSRTFHQLDAWRCPLLYGPNRTSGRKSLEERWDFTQWSTCRRCLGVGTLCRLLSHAGSHVIFTPTPPGGARHLRFTADMLNWLTCLRSCSQGKVTSGPDSSLLTQTTGFPH